MFDIEKARKRGLPESSIKILQHINENNAKCDRCAGHDFSVPPRPGKIPLLWVCTRCGYEADNTYVKGYHDAEFKAAKRHELLEEQPAAKAEEPVWRCKVCGCTNDSACPGGCWWVTEDLCSACAKENENE